MKREQIEDGKRKRKKVRCGRLIEEEKKERKRGVNRLIDSDCSFFPNNETTQKPKMSEKSELVDSKINKKKKINIKIK